jgi:hypothetical protein
VRRQTATSGVNPAGSSRGLRLDPHNFPRTLEAQAVRADNGVRRVELHRERVVLRRAVQGMRMAINLRVSDFRGIALRGIDDDAHMLVLLHRDPSLTIPLGISSDPDEIASAWQSWSDVFALPQLAEEAPCEAAPRRRRRNAIHARRPGFLLRRRGGGPLDPDHVHRGEREIIART